MRRRWRLVVATASLVVATPATADDIIGRASVIDGDTIEIHGTRIRLWGIVAPESDQLCRNDDSKLYRCGQQAATALDVLLYLVKRPVICSSKGKDQYGRTVAVCKVGDPGPDMAHYIVGKGLALDWPKYSRGYYAEAQTKAQTAGRGIWSGSFVAPWLYRACIRAGQRPSYCSDEAK